MGMKAASDSNELVFTLRVAPHTRNSSDLKSFADEVIKTQKRIQDGTSSIRGGKSSFAGFGIPDERELAKASAAQLRHQQRMAEAQKKALDKEQADVKKAADQKIREAKRTADAQIREAERAAAAQEREDDRLHNRHRQRQLNTARRNRTGREEAAANVVAGLDLTERREEQERNARGRRLGEAGRGFSELMRGGGDLARGVAYSGLVGEKDSQKVLDTLLRMEGTMGLIYGAISVGRGLSGLGGLGMAGVAAGGAVALAGATAHSFYSDPTFTGKSKNFGKDTQRLGWWNPANLYGRGKKGGFWDSKDDTDNAWRGFHEGVARADSQEKYLSEQAKLREGDSAEFSRLGSEREESREFRRRGHRGDAAERSDLQGDLLESQRALQELESQGAIKSEQQVQQRKALAKEIYDITRQIADADIRGQERVNALMLSRVERAGSIKRQDLDAQGGIAGDATKRYRSDIERFGEMDPLERMQVQSAAMAFRGGSATREQTQRLGGFNQFADEIAAHNARLGEAASGGLFSKPKEQVNEFAKRANEVITANHNVVIQHELKIVEAKNRGETGDAEKQFVEFLKDEFRRQEQETTKRLDDLRREINAQQRNREVAARR